MESILTSIQEIYLKFLGFFPSGLRPFVNIAVGVLIIVSIFQTLKRNFVWLIVLVILLPASVVVLKSLFDIILKALKYLFGIN